MTHVYWLVAERKKGEYPRPTRKNGKWLIFVSVDNVDEVWARIKKAVEEGRLGDSAKVATAMCDPVSARASSKVICVYTYDWTDEKDARRIRAEPRQLGITNRIPYKTDEDTLSGKYARTGYKRISKYYE